MNDNTAARGRPGTLHSSRPPGWVRIQVDDGVVVVTVAGSMDRTTTALFGAELLDMCGVCVGELVVDLSACAFLSREGLELLRRAQQLCVRGRCRLRVRADQPMIADALADAGILRTSTTDSEPRLATASENVGADTGGSA